MKGSLVFPAKGSDLHGLRYSPDGTRIIAGDYPSGPIQVWDARSGKQLVIIESDYGGGSGDYFHLSPDWRTVYVGRGKLSETTVEKDGKKTKRYKADGNVRAWDLNTGEVRQTFKRDPPRDIRMMILSPDGLSFVTYDDYFSEAGRRLQSSTLWDVKSKRPRSLPADPLRWASYSPDGRKLAVAVEPQPGRVAIKFLDVATAKGNDLVSLGIEKGCSFFGFELAPDGGLLIGDVLSSRTGERWMKFWDAATGRELASFVAAKDDLFQWWRFSPDGRMLAATNKGGIEGRPGKLFVFDLPGRKLKAEVPLGEKTSWAIRPSAQTASGSRSRHRDGPTDRRGGRISSRRISLSRGFALWI